MSKPPYISCLCPTYKRPEHLANVVRCFELQDYPKGKSELIVLDDADQYEEIVQENWRVISTKNRFPNLPSKFNSLAERSRGAILVPWEDDDIYLPWHLGSIASEFRAVANQFFTPLEVYSTYNDKTGEFHAEETGGRFHASWAFTRHLFNNVNGYTPSDRLTFDQELRQRMLRIVNATTYAFEQASYVYRWGNGVYHGSQAGDVSYASFYEKLSDLPSKYVGRLTPALDKETCMIFQQLGISY